LTNPTDDLQRLTSDDPRVRFAVEKRLRDAGADGVLALERFMEAGSLSDDLLERADDLHEELSSELAVETFRAAIPDPSAPALWAGAVAIAAEGHAKLDTAEVDRRLAALVQAATEAVPASDDVASRVARLTTWLFEVEKFRGGELMGDPRDSYFPDVLERRRGMPIALAVLWMTVAERLGIATKGVGLPLHFVARCEGADGPLFIDAFHGAVLDEEGCRRLVAKSAGHDVSLPARAFRPLRTTEILARMLRNLRALHESAGRLRLALACVDRALHLDVLDGAGLRDRALFLARLSRPTAAARAIGRILAVEPDAPDRERLEALRRQLVRSATERN
jgi:regulator of sirC expression with transglutaminase-like and TPR domain